MIALGVYSQNSVDPGYAVAVLTYEKLHPLCCYERTAWRRKNAGEEVRRVNQCFDVVRIDAEYEQPLFLSKNHISYLQIE